MSSPANPTPGTTSGSEHRFTAVASMCKRCGKSWRQLMYEGELECTVGGNVYSLRAWQMEHKVIGLLQRAAELTRRGPPA